MDYFFYEILSFLFWPLIILFLIIGGIVYFFRGRHRVEGGVLHDSSWYLRLSLGKEDALSQWFSVLAVSFFGVTLLALNRDVGDVVSWQTVLLVTTAVGLGVTYQWKTVYTLALSLVGVMVWWTNQAVAWSDGKGIHGSVVLVGSILIALTYCLLGRLHQRQERYRRFAMVYLVYGILFVTCAMFVLSTKSGLGGLGELMDGKSMVASWQLTASVFVIVAGFLIALATAWKSRCITMVEGVAIALVAVVFAVIGILPSPEFFTSSYFRYSYGGELTSTGIAWTTFLNIALFLELLGLVMIGYQQREEWEINLGAFFLVILVIVKYFDWFYTFLDKSMFFISAGVLLFILGWFMERTRRSVITSMHSS